MLWINDHKVVILLSYQHLKIEQALENLGGSIRLYKIILDGFEERYGVIDLEIRMLSGVNKLEEAERLAHTIKGLSGNLGAFQLREYANALENCYKKRDLTSEEGCLSDFRLELKKVIVEINQLLEEIRFDQQEATATCE